MNSDQTSLTMRGKIQHDIAYKEEERYLRSSQIVKNQRETREGKENLTGRKKTFKEINRKKEKKDSIGMCFEVQIQKKVQQHIQRRPSHKQKS